MGTPTVCVIGTGGTIAGVARDKVDFHKYSGGSLKSEELVAELSPHLGDLASVATEEFRGANPPGLKLADYVELSLRVEALLDEVDAVVVCSGSQLLEEMAYWLDLTVRSDRPVVVTGSIRPWNVLGSDGPVNLYNSIVLAASGRTAGFGTVVMLNDEVFGAREVTKTSLFRVHSFQAGRVGVLGAVDGDHIRLFRAPVRAEHAAPFAVTAARHGDLPSVEIAYTYVDAAASTIGGLIDGGAAGVVVAGDPSDGQFAAVRDGLEKGVAFVAAGRAGSGVAYETGLPGVLSAEDLLPQKARLLLVLSLLNGTDVEHAGELFRANLAPQF